MNDDTPRDETPEFAKFLKNMGVQALDNLATRITVKEGDARDAKPVRKIAEHWLSMDDVQKDEFFARVVQTAEAIAAAAPVVIASVASRAKAGTARAAKSKTKAKPATATDAKDDKKKKSAKKKKKKEEKTAK